MDGLYTPTADIRLRSSGVDSIRVMSVVREIIEADPRLLDCRVTIDFSRECIASCAITYGMIDLTFGKTNRFSRSELKALAAHELYHFIHWIECGDPSTIEEAHAMEFACDSYAARIAGAKAMAGALKKGCGDFIDRLFFCGNNATHPSLRRRVRNVLDK